MKRNILSRFRQAATAFGARHEHGIKRAMAVCGGLGDGSILAVPIIRNGFVHELFHGRLHPHLFSAAYSGDPVPIVASLVFVASSIVLGFRKGFPFSQAGYASGSTVMTKNCFKHGERFTGISLIPSIIGGTIGTFAGALENKFGAHKRWIVRNTFGTPKRTTGYCYLATNALTGIASVMETGSMIIPTVCWLAGNAGYFVLPPDQPKPAPEKVRPIPPGLSPAL